MAKPIPGQLNVPLPNEIGTRHNPDVAALEVSVYGVPQPAGSKP